MKRAFRYFAVGLFLLFAWPFFLYRKYGETRYKLTGNTIIVANHYSSFDPFFIWLAFRGRTIRFVTIVETRKKLVTRFVTWLFDCLYLDYSTKNFAFFKTCLRVLREGGVLCIFPEGAINPRKFGFLDFKGSFMLFAKKACASILPIYIYPELKAFRRSSVYIGAPLAFGDYSVYEDNLEAVTFVQSKIMEQSFLVPQGKEETL